MSLGGRHSPRLSSRIPLPRKQLVAFQASLPLELKSPGLPFLDCERHLQFLHSAPGIHTPLPVAPTGLSGILVLESMPARPRGPWERATWPRVDIPGPRDHGVAGPAVRGQRGHGRQPLREGSVGTTSVPWGSRYGGKSPFPRLIRPLLSLAAPLHAARGAGFFIRLQFRRGEQFYRLVVQRQSAKSTDAPLPTDRHDGLPRSKIGARLFHAWSGTGHGCRPRVTMRIQGRIKILDSRGMPYPRRGLSTP